MQLRLILKETTQNNTVNIKWNAESPKDWQKDINMYTKYIFLKIRFKVSYINDHDINLVDPNTKLHRSCEVVYIPSP